MAQTLALHVQYKELNWIPNNSMQLLLDLQNVAALVWVSHVEGPIMCYICGGHLMWMCPFRVVLLLPLQMIAPSVSEK